MALSPVTAPTAEPITLSEAKTHLRVDVTDDDTLITALITAARQYAETFQRRVYITQTWELILDAWPDGDKIEVPLPPLQSVASIKYYGTDNAEYTMPATDYFVDTKNSPGRIALAYGKAWPTLTLRPANGIVVRFVAGYGTPFTVDTATDTLTAVGHTLANGDKVRLSNSGGALPAGLSANTDYYVINASTNTLQLSATSGGAAIDITGTGTGTHFLGAVPQKVRQAILLLVAHWYETREPVAVGKLVAQVPMTVDALLWQDRVF